ncbi:MAG: hypothetical protein EPO08_11130 [Rhodospirillaceae bacterium]|nr:MAG: hypothetical protein EPO08_11130 [Rhodospirillaceae bacterium]
MRPSPGLRDRPAVFKAAFHVTPILFYLLVKRRNVTWATITSLQPAIETSIATAARLTSCRRLVGAVKEPVLPVHGVAIGFRI